MLSLVVIILISNILSLHTLSSYFNQKLIEDNTVTVLKDCSPWTCFITQITPDHSSYLDDGHRDRESRVSDKYCHAAIHLQNICNTTQDSGCSFASRTGYWVFTTECQKDSLLQPTFIIEFLNLEFDTWPELNIAKLSLFLSINLSLVTVLMITMLLLTMLAPLSHWALLVIICWYVQDPRTLN